MYADSEIQVVFSQLPAYLKEKVKLTTVSFTKVPDASGEGTCLVGFEGKNGAESSAYVPFKVLVKRKLYVVRRDIAKGDMIHLVDLTVKETFLNGASDLYPMNVEDILNKTAAKEIRAGEVITRQVLNNVEAVKKGDTVSMTIENSRLLVQAKGVALGKGNVGDVVKIKAASGKEVLGKVNGNDSVIVEF
jgi:flagella basal body P-ring formation protein FlgA